MTEVNHQADGSEYTYLQSLADRLKNMDGPLAELAKQTISGYLRGFEDGIRAGKTKEKSA